MKKRVVKAAAVLLCVCTMLFLSGCYKTQDDVARETRQAKEEAEAEKAAKEKLSFMETICGTYLVSGTGHLTGNAWYDEDLTTQDTTYSHCSLHVSRVDENTVETDVEGAFKGSGTVSPASPTVSYTSGEYRVTVKFTVTGDDAKVELTAHSDDSDCTEDVKLSGEK